MRAPASFITHPPFRAGIGVGIGYGLILTLLLGAVYLIPYAIFRLL